LPHLSKDETQDLTRVVEKLVNALQPERVYIFGSQARGEATRDSDVDLLLVVPASDLPPYRRSQLAYFALDRYLLPLDILVMTRDEFESRRSVVASLPATVLREGQLLYAA
jgi:uncharacterized protein